MKTSKTPAELAATLPSPDGDVVQRLRHTVAAFETQEVVSIRSDEFIVLATWGIYEGTNGKNRKTGLTWADLREILNLLEAQSK